MVKKVVAFADGENLVFRYQEMVDAGRAARPTVIHVRDSFVWAPRITLWSDMDLIRVSYYTSIVGTDQTVTDVAHRISETRYRCRASGQEGIAQLIPRVHKKPAASRKTKVVDVDITMDVMRAALEMPVDAILLLSGDGDYLPLVREITRTTSKQVYVAAFSSGLAEGLRDSVEAFVDLDPLFLE